MTGVTYCGGHGEWRFNCFVYIHTSCSNVLFPPELLLAASRTTFARPLSLLLLLYSARKAHCDDNDCLPWNGWHGTLCRSLTTMYIIPYPPLPAMTSNSLLLNCVGDGRFESYSNCMGTHRIWKTFEWCFRHNYETKQPPTYDRHCMPERCFNRRAYQRRVALFRATVHIISNVFSSAHPNTEVGLHSHQSYSVYVPFYTLGGTNKNPCPSQSDSILATVNLSANTLDRGRPPATCVKCELQ